MNLQRRKASVQPSLGSKDLFNNSVDLDQIKTVDHSEKIKGRSKSTIRGNLGSQKKKVKDFQRYDKY